MIHKKKLIIIDDDEKIIKVLNKKLEDVYDVVGFTRASDAIKQIEKGKFDLVILDYFLIDMSAEEVIKKIRDIDKDLYIFLLTGCDKVTSTPIRTLHNMDIQFYCEKSVNIEHVLVSIENALKSIEFLKKKNESFAMRLKELRRSQGVGQEELARYIGIGRTAVANWESGSTEPSPETLKKIATFFGVTTDYLLCYQVDYSQKMTQNPHQK